MSSRVGLLALTMIMLLFTFIAQGQVSYQDNTYSQQQGNMASNNNLLLYMQQETSRALRTFGDANINNNKANQESFFNSSGIQYDNTNKAKYAFVINKESNS